MRDMDDVATLLDIADRARHWPNLQPIHDAAMKAARQTTMQAVMPDLAGVAPPALTNFLGSMAPLLAGERMLVAVPFGIAVQ